MSQKAVTDALNRTIRETGNQYINKINYRTDFIDGVYINHLGSESPSPTACASVYIDLGGTDKFYTSAYAYGAVYSYDENFNFIKTLPNDLGKFLGEYFVDEGTRYVRLSVSNREVKNKIFFYLREEDLSVKSSVMYNSIIYEYGVTYTDLKERKELDLIPYKQDLFHTKYINTINLFSTKIIQEEGALINPANGVSIVRSSAIAYSHFIPVVGGDNICTNISAFNDILAYDKGKKFLGRLSEWYRDVRYKDSVRLSNIPEDAAFVRFNVPINQYSNCLLYIGKDEVYHKSYEFGDTFDIHFKYRGKKLVTIGDSITYQRTWQDRLCELTGLVYNPKEVRGDDESIRTEGHGYILLTEDLQDTEEYYSEVDGILKTGETVTDGFGYKHPIWIDTEGREYRQPCRTAEGGETVMPVTECSIYSRASDSKYYKGDVVIIFAGANDKISHIDKYPTMGDLSTIEGITNLKNEKEDISEKDFEIYTEDKKLTEVGDYTEFGSKTKKYIYTFRACFRGLLKRVVDANPTAKIIVIGPFATLIKSNEYISRTYDYLTIKQNEVIKECAREFSCQYIDLFPLFGRYNADRFFRGTDGTVFIHPTTEGGIKIAEYLASQL